MSACHVRAEADRRSGDGPGDYDDYNNRIYLDEKQE